MGFIFKPIESGLAWLLLNIVYVRLSQKPDWAVWDLHRLAQKKT